MAPEFFDPELPRGAVLSRRYIARMQRAVQAASMIPALPFGSRADVGPEGFGWLPETPDAIFARIIAGPAYGSPSSGGGDPFAYAAVQVYPGPMNTWVTQNANRPGLVFDNGLISGRKVNPLYEANDDTNVPPGTIVRVLRGYQHAGANWAYPGQEWVFFAGSGGGAGGGEQYVIIQDQGTQSTLGGKHFVYDADLPSPEWAANDFQEDDSTPVWLVHRRGRPLYPELVVPAHPTGDFYDPHPGGAGGASDPRELWSTIAVEEDHLTVTSDYSTTTDEGLVVWPAQVEFWRRSTKTKQTRTGTVYVWDWNEHVFPFQNGDKFQARFMDLVKVGGTPKPLFEIPVSAVTTDFVRCFMNRFEGRKGEIRSLRGLIDFLDADCQKNTDLDGRCIDGEE